MNRRKIAIIGGGIGGLTAGYFLMKKGYKITVFEKEDFLGGLAVGFKIEGENLERLYHHFFKTDVELIDLLKEIGLENKITWNKSSTGLYWKNKIYPFNGVMDLLKFKPLSLVDKLRMGLAALWLEYDKNWQKYEKILAYKWMQKRVGKEAYKVVWEPLLKGKFDKDYKKISMAWLWARIHTRSNSKDKKGHEILGYLDGGFDKLTERLAKLIEKDGGEIKLNSEIKNIRDLENDFDLIIDTRPVKEVKYLAAIDIVFSSEQSLSKYYWHNINDSKSPFIAFIQHTNLVGAKNYNGKNVYYLGTYISQKSKYFRMSDKGIEYEWLDYLRNIFPKFDRKKIREIKVFKSKTAQHIVVPSYKVPSYKVSRNRYRLNFAQIYPQDRGINYAVKEAKKLVKIINND
jgi:protoporphyrinogen oxidase